MRVKEASHFLLSGRAWSTRGEVTDETSQWVYLGLLARRMRHRGRDSWCSRSGVSTAQSCHLLVYFLSSWKLPHPWQISDADRELCRSMLEEDTCERVGFSTLCHWLPEKNLCVASPTGKVRRTTDKEKEGAEGCQSSFDDLCTFSYSCYLYRYLAYVSSSVVSMSTAR